ncbi:hypothetical protein DH09_19615 [Bacillaceae bacterium JMAK1]|nr:hypothetical protein DH09_19615 [Bacillaceae bacterium JMAK1]
MIENNVKGYNYLISIYMVMESKFEIPIERKNSYRDTVDYITHKYEMSIPYNVKLDLVKSKKVRNDICHFKPISKKEIMLLASLEKDIQQLKRGYY